MRFADGRSGANLVRISARCSLKGYPSAIFSILGLFVRSANRSTSIKDPTSYSERISCSPKGASEEGVKIAITTVGSSGGILSMFVLRYFNTFGYESLDRSLLVNILIFRMSGMTVSMSPQAARVLIPSPTT